jgi:oxalate decarboxylase/phosphoglucose isomerase-like protein (cupin superfamily)
MCDRIDAGGAMELKTVKREEARVFNLPGRDWFHYIGPEVNGAKNITVGYAVFPAGSAPEGHVHPTQEEVIYIVSGIGELVTPQGTATLEPGTTVYIPVGLHHATVALGTEPLEMVTSFSPPVVPGSYEED